MPMDAQHYFGFTFNRLDDSSGVAVYANVYWTEF